MSAEPVEELAKVLYETYEKLLNEHENARDDHPSKPVTWAELQTFPDVAWWHAVAAAALAWLQTGPMNGGTSAQANPGTSPVGMGTGGSLVVHPCCGCSCAVCADGHAERVGAHTDACVERFYGPVGQLTEPQAGWPHTPSTGLGP